MNAQSLHTPPISVPHSHRSPTHMSRQIPVITSAHPLRKVPVSNGHTPHHIIHSTLRLSTPHLSTPYYTTHLDKLLQTRTLTQACGGVGGGGGGDTRRHPLATSTTPRAGAAFRHHRHHHSGRRQRHQPTPVLCVSVCRGVTCCGWCGVGWCAVLCFAVLCFALMCCAEELRGVVW